MDFTALRFHPLFCLPLSVCMEQMCLKFLVLRYGSTCSSILLEGNMVSRIVFLLFLSLNHREIKLGDIRFMLVKVLRILADSLDILCHINLRNRGSLDGFPVAHKYVSFSNNCIVHAKGSRF
jgi:hypothetical protein